MTLKELLDKATEVHPLPWCKVNDSLIDARGVEVLIDAYDVVLDFILAAVEEAQTTSISVAEAGRRGGVRVRDTHGKEHFEMIGRQGGMAVRDSRDVEYFLKLGQKGGAKTASKRGREYFREIGRRGAQARQQKIEAELDAKFRSKEDGDGKP